MVEGMVRISHRFAPSHVGLRLAGSRILPHVKQTRLGADDELFSSLGLYAPWTNPPGATSSTGRSQECPIAWCCRRAGLGESCYGIPGSTGRKLGCGTSAG